jgi:hypothetical protein
MAWKGLAGMDACIGMPSANCSFLRKPRDPATVILNPAVRVWLPHEDSRAFLRASPCSTDPSGDEDPDHAPCPALQSNPGTEAVGLRPLTP